MSQAAAAVETTTSGDAPSSPDQIKLQIVPRHDEQVLLETKVEATKEVIIINPSNSMFMFKMKLSNFDLFASAPYQGIIQPFQTIVVRVVLRKNPKEINFMDPKSYSSKFLVEYGLYDPSMGEFAQAWKNSHDNATAGKFHHHPFRVSMSAPSNTAVNYVQSLQQKLTSQQQKQEQMAWLIAEQAKRLSLLEDRCTLLLRQKQALQDQLDATEGQ